MEQENNNYFSHNLQYIKDLSFENLGAPFSLVSTKPEIKFDIKISVNPIEADDYEVLLDIKCIANEEDKVIFIVDLKYAGLFSVGAKSEEDKKYMLMVKAPEILFPFARRVIADTTLDGGLPPLLLTPINFDALYQASLNENAEPDQVH